MLMRWIDNPNMSPEKQQRMRDEFPPLIGSPNDPTYRKRALETGQRQGPAMMTQLQRMAAYLAMIRGLR